MNVNAIVLSFILIPFGLYSQTNNGLLFPENEKKEVVYEAIINNSLTKEIQYNRAKEFVIAYFNDPKSVLQIDDKTEGKLLLKASINSTVEERGVLGFHFDIWTSFLFQIDLRDNRYRYRIYNLWTEFSGDAVKEAGSGEEINRKATKNIKAKYKPVVYQKVIQAIDADIQVLLETLINKMASQTIDDF